MPEDREEIKKRIRAGNPKGKREFDATAEIAMLRGRDPEYDQLHAKLIPPASASLTRLVELTHLSKTDIANRALQIYAFLEEEKQSGGELLLRKDGETQRVQII